MLSKFLGAFRMRQCEGKMCGKAEADRFHILPNDWGAHVAASGRRYQRPNISASKLLREVQLGFFCFAGSVALRGMQAHQVRVLWS